VRTRGFSCRTEDATENARRVEEERTGRSMTRTRAFPPLTITLITTSKAGSCHALYHCSPPGCSRLHHQCNAPCRSLLVPRVGSYAESVAMMHMSTSPHSRQSVFTRDSPRALLPFATHVFLPARPVISFTPHSPCPALGFACGARAQHSFPEASFSTC
jgi:hypothetical protein